MAIESEPKGRRSIGSARGSNGEISAQLPGGDFGKRASFDDGKPTRVTTVIRVVTVLAYIISVSTAAVLLSAYYIFIWQPHPSDPLKSRPTESPYSLAQHGLKNSHFSAGSYYLYPKNSHSNSLDQSRHMPPVRNKKNHYKTTLPPNLLPKPQYLSRRRTARPTILPMA